MFDHDLIKLFDDISDLIQHLVDTYVWVVALGSAMAIGAPPPLPKGGGVEGRHGPIYRLRSSFIYRWYYKLVNLCASNIGSARNLSRSSTIRVFKESIDALKTKESLDYFLDDITGQVEEKKKALDKAANKDQREK